MPGTNLRQFPNTGEQPDGLIKPLYDPLPRWWSPVFRVEIDPVGGKIPPSGTYVRDGLYTAERLSNGHLLYQSANGDGKTFSQLELWYESDFVDESDIQCVLRFRMPNSCPSQQFVEFTRDELTGIFTPSPTSREFQFQIETVIVGVPPNWTGDTRLKVNTEPRDPLDPDWEDVVVDVTTCGW